MVNYVYNKAIALYGVSVELETLPLAASPEETGLTRFQMKVVFWRLGPYARKDPNCTGAQALRIRSPL